MYRLVFPQQFSYSNMKETIGRVDSFGVFPWHQIAHVGVSERMSLKLFGREIIFEVFQPMWSQHLNVADGRTDGETLTATRNRLWVVAPSMLTGRQR